jgi:hypothetical protein
VGFLEAFGSGVFALVDDLFPSHLEDAPLGDWKSADIAAGVSQEMSFRHLPCDVDIPPPLLLLFDELIELLR